MTQLLIRKLPEGVKERLRARAREHGRSLEAEAREVLTVAAGAPAPTDGLTLSQRIRACFAEIGLTEEEHALIFKREPWVWRDEIDFSGPDYDPEPSAKLTGSFSTPTSYPN